MRAKEGRILETPKDIIELVKKFDSNQDYYRSNEYNETELRTEFINPFFEALGWDVYHKRYFRADEKEVKEEDEVEVIGDLKREVKSPDYSFRLLNKRKFFVEVKRPSMNVESSVSASFQLRRYAWSADLPISILTDFEEFSVYYCLTKPSRDDKATKSRLLYLRYEEYAERWNEIAALFSRDAVLNGSLDAYVLSIPDKKGAKRVDAALLDDISKWRNDLAKNIAKNNQSLSQKDLNYAVQMIIDRILFLRICEDRAIEPYAKLKQTSEGNGIYNRLGYLFKEADQIYNSGIFHFEEEKDRNEPPDTITMNLNIDDSLLSDIILNLYYPYSPYVFSKIPADILGQVYEQFLGKVIQLGENRKVEIEYKPEVRKAGGVYYTPSYIVDYIVKNTIAKLLEGKTPRTTSDLHILDPACGSGSFLIGAYQCLLDWHKAWYIANLVPWLDKGKSWTSQEVLKLLPIDIEKPERSKSKKIWNRATEASRPIEKVNGNEWRLTTSERKRILINNIYGVDIDTQAVEVTKLSLLLKVLEGETEATISNLLKYFKERALPDLGNNIKCGNSLIGWDILDSGRPLSNEVLEKINPFDWEKEFPEVLKNGGFDLVIGNPPYGASLEEITKDYFNTKFIYQNYQLDSYLLFLEQSIRYLLRKGGIYGMIIPNPWLTNLLQKNMRAFVTEKTRIIEIVHFKFAVFEGVTVDTQIVLLQNSDPAGWKPMTIIAATEDSFKSMIYGPNLRKIEHVQEKWCRLNGDVINIFLDDRSELIANKCQMKSISLDKLYKINVGIKPYQKGKGTPPQTKAIVENRPFASSTKIDDTYRLYLRGRDIGRFRIDPIEPRYLKYGPWLAEPRPAANFDAPKKILMRQTGDSLIAATDYQQYLCLNNMHVLVPKNSSPDINYILGILNSKLLNWYYQTRNPEVGEALAEVKKANVAALPIRAIDFSIINDENNYNHIVSLVEQMLSLHKQLHESNTPHEKAAFQRQIEAIDERIDALVYELYGLTEDEIKIVEEASP
jgi:type I restriction-modification system DNA methylase subunit